MERELVFELGGDRCTFPLSKFDFLDVNKYIDADVFVKSDSLTMEVVEIFVAMVFEKKMYTKEHGVILQVLGLATFLGAKDVCSTILMEVPDILKGDVCNDKACKRFIARGTPKSEFP